MGAEAEVRQHPPARALWQPAEAPLAGGQTLALMAEAAVPQQATMRASRRPAEAEVRERVAVTVMAAGRM